MKFIVVIDKDLDGVDIDINLHTLDDDHNPDRNLFSKILSGDPADNEMKLLDLLKDEVADAIYDEAMADPNDDRVKLN